MRLLPTSYLVYSSVVYICPCRSLTSSQLTLPFSSIFIWCLMDDILFPPLIQLINENLWNVKLCNEGINRLLFSIQQSYSKEKYFHILLLKWHQRLILYRCISVSHLLYLVFSSYNHTPHTHTPPRLAEQTWKGRKKKRKAMGDEVFTVEGKMKKIEQTRAPI